MSEYLKTATVLYVEDNEEVRLGYARTLARYTKEVYTAKDGAEGLELFLKHSPDIVISDIQMPHKNGIELAQEIRQHNADQIILFTTAHTDAAYTLPALELGIDGYLTKPLDKKILEAKINALSKSIICEKIKHEQKLLLEHILNHQSSITIVTDFNSIKFASRSFWQMFHSEDTHHFFENYDSFLTLFIDHPYYLHGKTIEEFIEKYNSCDSDMRLVSIVTKEGPVAFYINLDNMHDGRDNFFIITLTDVSSLQESRLNAVHHASHDKLTKIYNRHAFETHLEHEFLRLKRYGRSLCLALFDIDSFKKVNDQFGHLIGDEILKMIAKEIGTSLRGTDIFARWGGEEFVVLMGETSFTKAQKVAENIRVKVSNIMHPIAGNVTISVGLTKVSSCDDYLSLFARCDEALYRAKTNGKNRVEAL